MNHNKSMSVPWGHDITGSSNLFQVPARSSHSISNACCLAGTVNAILDVPCDFMRTSNHSQVILLLGDQSLVAQGNQYISLSFGFRLPSSDDTALWHLVFVWLLEKKCSATLEPDILEISPWSVENPKISISESIWIRRVFLARARRLSSASWKSIKSWRMLLRSAAKSSHLLRFKAQTWHHKTTERKNQLCGFAWYFDRYLDSYFKSSMKLSLRFFASWVKPEGNDEVRAWSLCTSGDTMWQVGWTVGVTFHCG